MDVVVHSSDSSGVIAVGKANPYPVYTRGYSFVNINTAATTQVATGASVLHSVTINTAAAGSITIYNNTGSDTDDPIAVIKASAAEGTFFFDVECDAGIKVVTAHNDSDITVAYK